MGWVSIEIKARCADPARIRKILKSRRADFKGLDHQIDTYFKVPAGRLKIREGNIENALIYYKRTNQKGSKRCDAVLHECTDTHPIKKIFEKTCSILAIVDKRREIYFIGNVKFHIDCVKGLGSFIEIEAQDRAGRLGSAKIKKQCATYQKLLGIKPQDLLADSYSDQLIRLKTKD